MSGYGIVLLAPVSREQNRKNRDDGSGTAAADDFQGEQGSAQLDDGEQVSLLMQVTRCCQDWKFVASQQT